MSSISSIFVFKEQRGGEEQDWGGGGRRARSAQEGAKETLEKARRLWNLSEAAVEVKVSRRIRVKHSYPTRYALSSGAQAQSGIGPLGPITDIL